jgi:hypothetical protein
MTIEEVTTAFAVDQWELDQCRYCKGPIEDPNDAYCSNTCELKWLQQQDEQLDNSPSPSSLFSADPFPQHNSYQSSPRTTPASSASSSPELGPILPPGSVPNLPSLDASFTPTSRRHSYAVRTHTYGSSHKPVKKSFPSNYYQGTVGERASVQPIFFDKSVSLGIRKPSTDEIMSKPMGLTIETQDRSIVEKKTSAPTSPISLTTPRGRWTWRRLSTFM